MKPVKTTMSLQQHGGLYLVLLLLKLELASELRLEIPLSLTELVSTGEVKGEARPRSNLIAESGLSGSELLRLILALLLAALLRNERREFSICHFANISQDGKG